MRKINVLFCEIYHDGSVGGSHSILFNLVKSINKENFDVSVLFYGDNLYVNKMRNIGAKVDIVNFALKKRGGNRIFRKLYNEIYKNYISVDLIRDYLKENKIDVLFINNTLYTSSNYIIAASSLGIPIIICERGINTYSKREIELSSRVYASVPMSDAIMESLHEQKLQSRKIIRIYDGIDFKSLTPKKNRQSVLDELNIPQCAQIAGIVGNIKPWKGQTYFIDGVMALADSRPDLYGVIIGGYAERDREYYNQIKEKIAVAGLDQRFVFTGYREDVADILGALDVFVHASTKPEPFGMVVPEAMAARTPAVATNFGGPLESLDYGNCGILVPPCDGSAIAEAIDRYLSDSAFMKETVEKAYTRCVDFFDLYKNISEIEQLIADAFLSGGVSNYEK